jgi:triosephosphate isomerase
VKAAIDADHVPVALGAQTCHFADAGAYTGEVSAGMLATLEVRYVIAGHSERRAQWGETDEVVRDKVDAIYRHAMRPILCIGETTDERHSGVAEKKVRRQVAAALGDRPAELVAAAVIAYEPLWAIGAGATATPDDLAEMCTAIRDELGRLAGADAAAMVRIQYGGSVTAETSEVLLGAENVDGFLVGGASLDAEQFAAIVIG